MVGSTEMTTLSSLAKLGALFCDGDWIESKDQDQDGDVRLIQLADIGDGYFINKSNRFMTMKKAKELRCTFLKKGDVLIARMPDPLGRACIFPLSEENKYVTVVDIAVFRPNNTELDPNFLMAMVNSPQIRHQISMLQSGTTRKRISRGNLGDIPIPLPHIEKQKSAVHKIYSLFSEIDSGVKELESAKQNLELYRQSILNAAIRGELVPQDPEDEPASKLLEKIQKEKEKLIAEKKIKKEKPLSTISEDEIPFEIPKGWIFAKLQQLSLQITDGEHATPERADSGKLLLSARNVTNEGIRLDKVDYVPEKVFKKIRERCAPQKDDLFLSCSGSVGRCCLVDKDDEYSLVRSAALVKPFKEYILPEYLCFTMQSPYLQDQIKKASKSTAQANIFLGPISNLVIPVPPVSEQRRILKQLKAVIGQIQETDNVIEFNLDNALNLKKSILKKVFEGEL